MGIASKTFGTPSGWGGDSQFEIGCTSSAKQSRKLNVTFFDRITELFAALTALSTLSLSGRSVLPAAVVQTKAKDAAFILPEIRSENVSSIYCLQAPRPQ